MTELGVASLGLHGSALKVARSSADSNMGYHKIAGFRSSLTGPANWLRA
jgi:hypothetical protein